MSKPSTEIVAVEVGTWVMRKNDKLGTESVHNRFYDRYCEQL
jgi:hypothetical protein